MRPILAATLGLWFLLLGTPTATADEPDRTISVSGTVATKAAPDHIEWRVRLEDFDKDLRAAKRRNDDKVEAVLALRRDLDIDDEDLETGYLSIRREYERGERGERGRFKHFVVHRSVTIRQRELRRFDEFLDTLIATSEMEVDFSFESSKIHQLRADTRLKALQAAKEKAAAMAEVVGAKLGPVVTIQEHRADRSSSPGWSNTIAVDSPPPVDMASDRFVPGAISVQVSVYATFELR
ncbi:MAG: SIMPL domain-containing protein [Planctomycetota bacterium]|jgi:uncharacterized protein YggE